MSCSLIFGLPSLQLLLLITLDRIAISGGKFTAKRPPTTYDFISPLNLDLVAGAAFEDGVGCATSTVSARAGQLPSQWLVCMVYLSEELAAKLNLAATQAGRDEPKVICCQVDTAQPDSVQVMHNAVLKGFDGRLDVLVNNAAHMEPHRPFLDTNPQVYWRSYEVNVRGLTNMYRAILPVLLSTRSAHDGLCTMINVASAGALTARPGSGSYRSSKLAIVRCAETLQLEYEDQGLVALSVNPGAIKTEITKVAHEAVRNKFPDKPAIAGDSIVWLAAERNEWLGGRYVDCPWDMEELLAKKDEVVEEDKLKMRIAF